MRPIVLVTLITAAAAGAAFASAGPPREVARTTLSFYRAYAGGDLDAAMAFWSPLSESRDVVKRRSARFLRTRCLRLGRIDVTRVDVDGNSATAFVQADWLDAGTTPGELPFVDFADGIVTLRREPDGWRILDWTPAVERLADDLASGDAARRNAAMNDPRRLCRAAARALSRRAVVLVNQHNAARAHEVAEAAKAIAYETGDEAALAFALASESVIIRYDGSIAGMRSIDTALDAIQHAAASHNADAEARAYLTLGRANPLLENFTHALSLRDHVTDASLLAMAASQIAQFHAYTDNHRAELQYGILARAYADESGDAAAMISAELNVASTYVLYHDYTLAAAAFRKAIALCERNGFRTVGSVTKVAAAQSEMEAGRQAEAMRWYAEVSSDPDVRVLAMISRARYEQRDEVAIREMTALLRDGSPARDVANLIRQEILRRRLHEGRLADAEVLVREILPEGYKPTDLLFEDLVLAAGTERRLGRLDAALKYATDAIELTETERSGLLADWRQQASFTASRLSAYAELLAIRVARGEPVAALAAADEMKGRTLLDILRSHRAALEAMATAEERRQEKELHEREEVLRRRFENAAAEDRRRAVDDLTRSRTDIEAFEAGMIVKYPRAVPVWSSPLRFTPALLDSLVPDSDTALLEFLVSDDRLVAFAVTREHGAATVRVRSVPITAIALRKRIARYVATLSRVDLDYRSESRGLYNLLIRPFASRLSHARVVCIVPDGPLWQLPFETLTATDGKFFVEHAAPFYAPSLAVYATMREKTRTKAVDGTFFALADPAAAAPRDVLVSRLRAGENTALPDAAREVETAARILGGKSAVYVGASASRLPLEREASRYRVIHFATHGILDDLNPMYSHLVLAPSGTPNDDGVLETWELMRMHFNADVAVFSACDTARGRYQEGEGVIGMSWALFVAGCPATITAEWKIASATTADLMIEFYRQWHARGDGPFAKATALAAAQRTLLRRSRRRHPFYWGPFILVGVG